MGKGEGNSAVWREQCQKMEMHQLQLWYSLTSSSAVDWGWSGVLPFPPSLCLC